MKTLLLVVTCAFCVVRISVAQSSISSPEVKSGTLTRANDLQVVHCQVNFDASGHKSVVLMASTGSKALDDYIPKVAAEYLNGPRNTSISVSILCKAIEVPSGHGKVIVRVAATHPPYPFQARARHEQGSGIVNATFDESGHVVSADMARSTGSAILDGNTVNYARSRWRSSGGEKVTTTIPISYGLK